MTLVWINQQKVNVIMVLLCWGAVVGLPAWAQSAHKPGAGIYAVSPEVIYLSVGVLQDIAVTFSNPSTAGDISLALSNVPHTLEILGTARTWSFRGGDEITIPLSLRASAGGRYHLKFIAQMSSGGRSVISTTGLAVQVASSESTAVSMKKATVPMEHHVMQAQETIITP